MSVRFFLALALIMIFVRHTSAQPPMFLPTEQLVYSWEQGAWKLASKHRFIYNSLGKQDTTFTLDIVTGNPISKIAYLYDQMGQEAGSESYNMENGKWIFRTGNHIKRAFTNGNLTEEIRESSINGTLWEEKSRNVYTYDQQGHILTHIGQARENGAWANKGMDEYDPARYEMTRRNWSNGQWEPNDRFTDIEWQIPNKLFQAYINQSWNAISQTWDNQTKYKRSITDTYGSYADLMEFWDADSGSWVPVARYASTFDSLGNVILVDSDHFRDGYWHQGVASKNLHTYNGYKLEESIIQRWDEDSLKFVNNMKYVYSGHILSTDNELSLPAQPIVKVYPNPVSGLLHITTDINYNTAIFTDLSGKIMMMVQLYPSSRTINVSALPPGYYLLRLTGREVAPAVSKVVKK